MDIGSYIIGETAGLLAGIMIFAVVLIFKNWNKSDNKNTPKKYKIISIRYSDVFGGYFVVASDGRSEKEPVRPEDLFNCMNKFSDEFNCKDCVISFEDGELICRK